METQKVLPPHLSRSGPGQGPVLRPVLLTDSVISALTSHPQLRTEFPFVKAVPTLQAPKCKPCSKGKSRMSAGAVDVNNVKENLVNMSSDSRERFKRLIGASQITFFLNTPSGVKKYVL